jgi:type 1 fimbria pilin
MKTRFLLIKLMLALLVILLPHSSKASVYCSVYSPYQNSFAPPNAKDMNLNVATGGVIWSGTFGVPATFKVVYGCNNGAFAFYYGVGTAVNGVYPTGVPGIGYRIHYQVAPGTCGTAMWPTNCWFNNPGSGGVAAHTLAISFIKTGPISRGTLSGLFGSADFRDTVVSPPSTAYLQYSWLGKSIIEPPAPTCAVNTSSINQSVALGSYRTTDFANVGSMTPAKDFAIQFNCSGGDAGTVRDIYLTLTDSTVPSNRTNILNLTPSSTTSGLGVRIERSGGTPVSFGADSAAIGNPGQWLAGTVAQGTSTYSVPLRARFIRTGSVRPGSANAIATFTVAYN